MPDENDFTPADLAAVRYAATVASTQAQNVDFSNPRLLNKREVYTFHREQETRLTECAAKIAARLPATPRS